MTQKLHLLSIFAIAAILLTSTIVVNPVAFADKDDDDDDDNSGKKHKVFTGDGPPKNKQGNIGDGYIDNTSEGCDYYVKTAKKTWTLSQNLCGDSTESRVDSFFDVFYDIELYSVDSFFDIFTDLQRSAARADSFFDVFFDVDAKTPDSFFDVFVDTDTGARPDSFFDVFVELDQRDRIIQTEIVALDLRGQSCGVGDVVTGFVTRSDGTIQIQCAPQGGNPFGDLQQAIDDKNAEIVAIQSDIATAEAEVVSLQSQISTITTSSEFDRCQDQFAKTEQQLRSLLAKCQAEAAVLGVDPAIHCAELITALANHLANTCEVQFGIPELQQRLVLLQAELDALNELLEDCQSELLILQTLQNQFGLTSDPTPGI